MKIALVGNMNNFNYNLARYLADRHVDCYLFLLDEPKHFKPESDSMIIDERIKVVQTNWSEYYFFDPLLVGEIEKDLINHKFFIACDWGPAYLRLIGKMTNIFIPYGSDLYYFPFYNLSDLLNIKSLYYMVTNQKISPKIRRANLQKRAILQAQMIIFDYINESYENIYKGIVGVNRMVSTVPMYYIEPFNEVEDDVIDILKDLKRQGKLLIYSNIRHQWTDKSIRGDYKGNEIILTALSVLRERRTVDFIFVTHEYGNDVEESKKLASRLNISDNILWLPAMSRARIRMIYPLIDIGIATIGYSFYTYGVLLEMIANKIPVVLNYKDSFSKTSYKTGYAAFHAKSPIEISNCIEAIIGNPKYTKLVADYSYSWYEHEVVSNVCSRIIDLVKFAKS